MGSSCIQKQSPSHNTTEDSMSQTLCSATGRSPGSTLFAHGRNRNTYISKIHHSSGLFIKCLINAASVPRTRLFIQRLSNKVTKQKHKHYFHPFPTTNA